ncbi:hypothetical protein NPIL_628911 [Nephila pilipes]|uniref:Uncharacterized protein n=1 Tax=Nephila pilipes TaxID=299642 RepID=A0A8X6ULL0_NEPPI|nr:hypothetical protein NPIL_628911 [Nephila pilipes]
MGFQNPPRHIPAFERRFLPSSWEESRFQIFFHHHERTVFSRRDNGFTLTNSVVSHALDSGEQRPWPNVLPISTLVRSVSPMSDPRCNFGLFKIAYLSCPLGSASSL